MADVYLAHILESLNRPTLLKPPGFLPKMMKAKLIREGNTAVVLPFCRRRVYPEQIADKADKLVMMFRFSMTQEFEGLGCIKGRKLIYSQWPGYLDCDRMNIREWCAQQGLDFEILHVRPCRCENTD